MNRKRILQAVAALTVFGLLYATGWLWPLLRLTLALCGIATIALALYCGTRLAAKARSRDAGEGVLSASDYLPVVVASLTALIAFALMAIVPRAQQTNSVQPQSVTTDSSTSLPATSITGPQAEADELDTARSTRSKEAQGLEQRNRDAEDEAASRAAAEFMGALIGAGIEQQQRQQADPRYQRFKQSIEKASACPRCGGAGTYRYVDGRGVLQSRSCPSCYGSGRAY